MANIGNSRKVAETFILISISADFRVIFDATDVQKLNITLFRSFTDGKKNYDMHLSAKFANFA